MQLDTPIGQINHIAKKMERHLKNLGINTIQDLLFYLPFRYQDYSSTKNIADLEIGEEVTIKAKIEIISNRRIFKRRTIMTEAIVYDETGKLKIVWFGQPFITHNFKPGDMVYLSGKLSIGKLGKQMVSPSYEKETKQKALGEKGTTHTARIVPIYHLTTGVTNKQLRFLVSQIIDLVDNLVEEWIPDEILDKADLVFLSQAVRGIHFPIDEIDLAQARKRLKFGELFILQLRAEMIRQSLKRSKAWSIKFQQEKIKEFVSSLSFELTKAQKVSAWDILRDLEKNEPMNRLLEGDVGSGKTIVAAMALYNTVLNNYQAVIMAPTEILAMQHFDSLTKLLGKQVRIALLTRSQFSIFNFQFSNNFKLNNEKKPKKQICELIKNGEVQIIIGTHALLSEKVEFKNLGLVIIDEQHRFGVEQRKTMREKSGNNKTTPHLLSMTATPIPRSFALTLYGDLDLSIINEMPMGRKPVDTRLVSVENRSKAYDFIRNQIKLGRQAFVICPLISQKSAKSIKSKSQKSDDEIEIINYPENSFIVGDEKKSVESEYEKLSKQIFPDLNVGYLHGKLKPNEKENTMTDFSTGKIDILVSTSVVEVGVNIPNATVMMIEGADRFGLAQLHQFRGRVGRALHQSYCFLFTDTDNEKSLDRLQFFSHNTDGFKIAEYDLQTRGPGEVYGTSQSGLPPFKLATMQDMDLIKLSRDLARGIDFKKNPSLVSKVKDWEDGVHLE
ncbi:MAG: ATP-dependent DNA helicase RecG [Candidatus Magasanikiibacteriota bacterium]